MTVEQPNLKDRSGFLGTGQDGLSTAEADRRRQAAGPNEPATQRRTGPIVQLLLPLCNPLALILLVASGISAALGDPVGAAIIIAIVLASASINFVQTYRSQQAIERLRNTMTPTATVLRDGTWREINRRDVVPADVIRLAAGDLVPADARLLAARDLYVQQSALTGESLPVEKQLSAVKSSESDSADDNDMVFFGTSVVSGTGTALVLKTGSATAFGEIATRLATRAPATEFDLGTRRFGFLILQTVLFLVLVVFLANIVLRRDPLQSLLFSVALAVGLTPEFLPMIIAVTLSHAAVQMARQKVVVKHLTAMQNLGSVDVLCSDKTGTLTSGQMALDRCTDPLGKPSPKTALLAYLNSFYETGIKSSLDAAILQQAKPDITSYQKVDEIPFDFQRRRLSIVVAEKQQQTLITKGAPESVLGCCTMWESDGGPRPLDAAAHETCQATFQAAGRQGLRVLAIAYRVLPSQAVCSVTDEKELVLAGFATFVDPPLEDAAEAIRSLRRDGVNVKILTGDNELVTRYVCNQVGLDATQLILGDQLVNMNDAALGHVAEETIVFARVSPVQKDRIILALKQRGHVVGYLGDGINDAPSLHVADVGISVSTAVDVAKDAADIILLERSLSVLHTGIREGRKAFGNVMKYLLMGTSSNFGNMFSMAAACFFLPFLPMLPMQILFNNLLYDLSQLPIPTDRVDNLLIRKPRHWDIRLIRDFMWCVGPVSSIYDILTFVVLLKWFQASETLFHTGWFVESLTTQTLVIFVIRTAGNPLRSRPSTALVVGVLSIVLIGLALPYSPLAEYLGFVPLPATYLIFLGFVTATYLLVVEWIKRRLMRRWLMPKVLSS